MTRDIDRRKFLKAGLAGMAVGGVSLPAAVKVAAESSKKIREFHFTAYPASVGLGNGPEFKAWTYNGKIPGPEIRVKEGEIIRVVLKNELPEPTTIHWHGIPLQNAMDGVPGVTQDPIPPKGTFTYEFVAKPAGTFFYHSHCGYQLDQGLYGLLVIEPARERLSYDQEYSLMLEDWVMKDHGGIARIMRRPPLGPRNRNFMDGRVMGGDKKLGEEEPLLEPYYDSYAVNGKIVPAIDPIRVKKGDLVRLRIVNASSATNYDLRLANHKLFITHTDGNPVRPQQVDILRIGMGERYDVAFRANKPGRWLLAARDTGLGESQIRIPVIYDGISQGKSIPPMFWPNFEVSTVYDLEALEPVGPPEQKRDQYFRQVLQWASEIPHWTINGYGYPKTENLTVRKGEWAHIEYYNHSPMPHPMHLHGHFFRIVNLNMSPEYWIKKDTFLFDAHETVHVEFLADNPGRWFHHCHNLYHMVDGMANEVVYKQT